MPDFAGCPDISTASSSWTRWLLTTDGKWRGPALCAVALLIASIYLPTIGTNFDFQDDGATAHPQGVATVGEFNALVWKTTAAEFRDKGPYRPVAWYFWIGQEELFAGHPLSWRLFRFAWTALATLALLAFLQELGFSAIIATATALAAMWNGYRAEVWLSPTFCEGIAMPFALAGLFCAYRAPRSQRAWLWDLGAIAGAAAAVGCKNVFAAVIFAQMFLRVSHPDLTLRQGVTKFGSRAALLGVTIVLPVAHFICYRLTMNATRYDMAWDIHQPGRLLNGFLGAIGKDFLGPALLSALVLSAWASLRRMGPEPTAQDRFRARTTLGAGGILFLFGFAVYAPMAGVAGRYTLPGVWGLDLICAVLWARVAMLPGIARKLIAAALVIGLAISAVSLIGKQEKNTARIATLWDALYAVEASAPPGARIGWVAVPDRVRTEELELCEGIHFLWHLHGRGRRDLYWQNLAPHEPLDAGLPCDLLLTSSTTPPSASWQLLQECRHSYWFGRKEVICCVWRAVEAPGDKGK